MRKYAGQIVTEGGTKCVEVYIANEIDTEMKKLKQDVCYRKWMECHDELMKNRIEIARLQKALETYAERDNWAGAEVDFCIFTLPGNGWEIAREALAPEKEKG